MTPHAENLILKKLAERPGKALAAIHLCLERGWQGFEWEWMDNGHFGPREARSMANGFFPEEDDRIT